VNQTLNQKPTKCWSRKTNESHILNPGLPNSANICIKDRRVALVQEWEQLRVPRCVDYNIGSAFDILHRLVFYASVVLEMYESI
jgi:hypothetical protein